MTDGNIEKCRVALKDYQHSNDVQEIEGVSEAVSNFCYNTKVQNTKENK